MRFSFSNSVPPKAKVLFLLVVTVSLTLGQKTRGSDDEETIPDHLKELAWAYAISIEKPPP
ncbi:MAG: hypothetical protein KDN05_15915, partial [Verrucomicrobiae bacterium]|nr:hypothetical protein [Verrucomicrobiae bacterium]